MAYAEMKARFAESPFRSRFRLSDRDRAYLADKGWPVIEAQARDIVVRRLAPAFPDHDGRQTPMRGHPVFLAQHATATCCRGCLAKWHGIPAGRPLTESEIVYIAAIIADWLKDRAGDLSVYPATPDLFSGNGPSAWTDPASGSPLAKPDTL